MFNNIASDKLLVIPLDKKQELLEIVVDHLLEKRNGLDYLPWAEAQILLESNLPGIRVGYETCRRGGINEQDPIYTLVPWFDYGQLGCAVYAYLYEELTGKRTPPIYFPVMDYKHKAHPNPTVCDINNSLQRAAVKAIALNTWIGLNVFRKSKEDVPQEVAEAPKGEPMLVQPAVRFQSQEQESTTTYHSDPQATLAKYTRKKLT
jgi:Protein of unknown function (DUF1071)